MWVRRQKCEASPELHVTFVPTPDAYSRPFDSHVVATSLDLPCHTRPQIVPSYRKPPPTWAIGVPIEFWKQFLRPPRAPILAGIEVPGFAQSQQVPEQLPFVRNKLTGVVWMVDIVAEPVCRSPSQNPHGVQCLSLLPLEAMSQRGMRGMGLCSRCLQV